MSNYLPKDLLLDVFSRLPVKSLKRFTCVSKQWKNVIESLDFINMHLEKSSSRVVIGTALEAQAGLAERYFLFSSEEFGSEESFLRTREEICCPLEDFPDRNSRIDKIIRVVGSCNGLICIQYSKYDVLVWNPWIRKHWTIPRTRVETELAPNCRRVMPHDTFTYGFGYDDVNDDYKVVRMVQLQTTNYVPLGVEVKVFSMKSNLWRRVQDFPYTSYFKWRRIQPFPYTAWSSIEDVDSVTGVLANGSLHWVLTNDEPNPLNSILAIDLSTEKQRLLPMPESLTDFCLSSFDGELCFFTEKKMWLMQKDSWRIVIDMELREDFSLHTMQPIAYSADEGNWVIQTCRELLWFNYERLVPEVSLPAFRGAFCDIFCSVASLVEPKCGGKKRMKRMKRRKKDLKQQAVSLKRCHRSLENTQLKKRGRILVSSW